MPLVVAMAAVALGLLGAARAAPCDANQTLTILPSLVSAVNTLPCFATAPRGTPITHIPNISACHTQCHGEVIDALNGIAGALRDHSDCTLGIAQLPSVVGGRIRSLFQSLLGNTTSLSAAALEADVVALQRPCGGASSLCQKTMSSLFASNHVECLTLASGELFQCYCEYVQQQQAAGHTPVTAQQLSNQYCGGSKVPVGCYPMAGDCAPRFVLYPQCKTSNSSGGGGGGGTTPSTTPTAAPHSNDGSNSRTVAIIVSVVVVSLLVLAIFTTLCLSRMADVRRTEAFSALHYVDDDDDDDRMLNLTPEEGAMALSDIPSSGNKLQIGATVYEGDPEFSTGEDHRYA